MLKQGSLVVVDESRLMRVVQDNPEYSEMLVQRERFGAYWYPYHRITNVQLRPLVTFERPTRNVGLALTEVMATHEMECQELMLDGSGELGARIADFFDGVRNDIARKHGFECAEELFAEVKARVTAKWAWNNLGM